MRTCPKCKKDAVASDGYCAADCREITMQPLAVEETAAVVGAARCSAEPIPMVLFRGEAVWRELNDNERTRTTAINVSDVLDAVVRLMRREARHNTALSGAEKPTI